MPALISFVVVPKQGKKNQTVILLPNEKRKKTFGY